MKTLAIVMTTVGRATVLDDTLARLVPQAMQHGVVIEINDNPSIDHDVEDLVLKESLYDAVIGSLVRRIESHTAPR